MPEIHLLDLGRLLFGRLIEGVRDFKALSKAQSDWRLMHNGSGIAKDIFARLLDARDP